MVSQKTQEFVRLNAHHPAKTATQVGEGGGGGRGGGVGRWRGEVGEEGGGAREGGGVMEEVRVEGDGSGRAG